MEGLEVLKNATEGNCGEYDGPESLMIKTYAVSDKPNRSYYLRARTMEKGGIRFHHYGTKGND